MADFNKINNPTGEEIDGGAASGWDEVAKMADNFEPTYDDDTSGWNPDLPYEPGTQQIEDDDPDSQASPESAALDIPDGAARNEAIDRFEAKVTGTNRDEGFENSGTGIETA
ncbi:MAG: hypothetical protein Q4E70_01035 [Candidatus Saccharibacteria bacterium]|nr:hypothetical protein [Candidatus Saccharibacteria bacterium]